MVRLARRHKVAATAVAGVAASLVAAVVGISVFAIRAEQAKREADVQREEATAQRDAAEQARAAEAEQRGLAEQQKVVAEENEKIARKQALLALETIQFVLKDVDGKLRQLPRASDVRLAVLDTLSTKMGELDTKLTGGVRGESIPTLMAIRQGAAVIYQDLGRLDEANRELERLYAMSGEDMDRSRCDTTRFNRSMICLSWAKTSPTNAVALLEEGLALARECLSDPKPYPGSPSRRALREGVAAHLQDLGARRLTDGNLLNARDMFAEAEREFDRSLEEIRESPEFSALDEQQRADSTQGLETNTYKMRVGLAWIDLRLGRMDDALSAYERTISDCRDTLVDEKRNAQRLAWKSELAGYLALYGRSLTWINELDRALPILRESVVLSDEVHTADPEKVFYARSLSTALYRLAIVRDLQGDAVEAGTLQERCRSLRQALADATPNSHNLYNLMEICARSGRSEQVRQVARDLETLRGPKAPLTIDHAQAFAQMSRHVPEADRPAVIAEALTALEQAVDGGFSDPFRVKCEPDLAPLRGEARFAAVVARLEAPH